MNKQKGEEEEEEKNWRALDLYKPPLGQEDAQQQRPPPPHRRLEKRRKIYPAQPGTQKGLASLPARRRGKVSGDPFGRFTHLAGGAWEGEAAGLEAETERKRAILAPKKKKGQLKKRDVARASVPGIGRVSLPPLPSLPRRLSGACFCCCCCCLDPEGLYVK